MKRRFVILHNGLKDQCGHYFETSVALAEAAQELGLRPVLATHVTCPVSLFPEWLEVYPLFCTDHWMGDPAAQAPDLGRVRLDPYERLPITAEDVRCGRALVRDLLQSRFHLITHAPPPPAPPAAKVEKERPVLSWLADRLGYYLLPPALGGIGRTMSRVLRAWMPRLAWREERSRLAQGIHRHWRLLRGLEKRQVPREVVPFNDSPILVEALWHPVDGLLVERAQHCLTACGLGWELIHSLIFKRDLERLLALTGLGPEDHVLLSTAHGREVLAVILVVRRLGESRAPTFHFEFRHALFASPPSKGEIPLSPQAIPHKAFFDLYREMGQSPRLRFYTDTDELSRDYALLSGLPFGVLPLPFRTRLMQHKTITDRQPLVLAYIGEARDEKGFPWLPMLIDWLFDSHVRTGKVRFLIQATLVPGSNPLSTGALEILRRYPSQVVQFVGAEGPLSPEAYYHLVSEADIVLLPYDAVRYRACSSGTLAEAIAAGHPVVVPEGTWLSAQMPPGGGETFRDFISFVEAVRRVVDDFHRYREAVVAARAAWLMRHNPRVLIETVMQTAAVSPFGAARAA